MRKRQLYSLLDLLDLLLKAANVRVSLSGCLFQFHNRNHWVSVIRKHANNRVSFVVEQDRAAWFKLLFIDE